MKKLVALILAMMLAIGCISFASAEDEKVLKVGITSMSAHLALNLSQHQDLFQ